MRARFALSLKPPKPEPQAKKRYARLNTGMDHAAGLQQRVMAGTATTEEAREYQRILAVYRAKFRQGSLSPANARRFGID